MALQNNIILIRIVLIIGYLLHGYQCVVLPSPKVDTDVLEHIISTNNNFSILCEGNAPLKWVSPSTKNDIFLRWTNISYHDVVPKHNHYKYASQLYIENATFPLTGYYRCFEQGNSNSSNIYLYVSDDEHLSVFDQPLETLIVTQYSEVTIPCRPTSPDVKVTLQHMSGEEEVQVDMDVRSKDDTMFRYLPTEGFITNATTTIDTVLFECYFKKGNKTNVVTIIMDMESVTDSLAQPYIVEEGDVLHHVVGDTIILKCMVKTQVSIDIIWETPTGNIEGSPRQNVSELTTEGGDANNDFKYQRLTIGNVTLADRGTYSCNVKDRQGHFNNNTYNVTIYDLNEGFINLTEEHGKYEIHTEAGVDSVQWAITINAHPQSKVTWLTNQNIKIPLGRTLKYETSQTEKNTVLMIRNISITDFGNYTVVAENKFEKKFLSLFLNVTAKPSVQLKSGNDYHIINEPDVITCIVAAYPEPIIAWEFKPCLDDSCQYQPIHEGSSYKNAFEFISNLTLKLSTSGFVRCSAANNEGNDSAVLGFYVTDIKNGLNIFGLRDDIIFDSMQNYAIVATGEEVELICGASVHNYTGIKWFHNSTLISSDDTYSLQSSQTLYSNRLMLTISNIGIQDQGLYTCQAESVDDHHVLDITLSVKNPIAPEIIDSNMPISNNIEMDLPERLELHCVFEGLPKPTITWFKDNEVFSPTDGRVIIEENNEKISFSRTETKDEATYSCEGSNKVGKTSRQASIVFKNKPTTAKYISIIVVLIFLLVIGLAILLYKIRKQKELVKALAESGLANFEKGALENLNPELGIDDQAELLPYDKKWEFPISNLKLGKQLGSGAFGVVMRGEAKGILEDEKTTTVAVKMVKRDAGHTFVKALASELKIMVHLGKHLNVVNLLGACTKNVAKRELLVIVEFCRFGNLHNYLYRHRENYIDQIDPRTEQIDFNIGQEILERAYSIASNRSNYHQSLKNAAISISNNSNSTAVPNNMGDYRGPGNYSGVTMKTDITTVSMSPNTGTGEDSMGMSNSNCQPEWCTNYKGDYKGNVKPISTKDLLAWAFQVARGMEYLASRKILHGDLAARNILLADENIVKICDFGLAKSMYKNDNYKKNSDGPLPVKWMAIESIRDRVFSTQSDVWSFGILLWEFFSLARTPYPGMEANEDLYKKIVEGYRMECPEYATKSIYTMMLDCWHVKPLNRPSFVRLTERLGTMLEDSVRQHYIDLNDPYLMMNTQRLVEGHSDYLAMLTSPNFENLSSPQPYVNVMPASPSENVSGYMSMTSPNIFSPRSGDENVFDFDLPQNSPTSKVKSAEGTGNEMMPMLQTRESESDTPCYNPTTPFSFANPSYQLPPVISDTVFDKNERDIVKSVDNYVNMPQNKILVKEKNNNPLIKVDEDTKDVHYVNSNSRDWNSIAV